MGSHEAPDHAARPAAQSAYDSRRDRSRVHGMRVHQRTGRHIDGGSVNHRQKVIGIEKGIILLDFCKRSLYSWEHMREQAWFVD